MENRDADLSHVDPTGPGQFVLAAPRGTLLQIGCTKALSLRYNSEIIALGASPAVFYDDAHPNLVVLQWHLPEGQEEAARRILQRHKLRLVDRLI